MGQLIQRAVATFQHVSEASTPYVHERGPWLYLAAPFTFALTVVTIALLAR